jgi:DNA mismatch endonuclease, patch repair protein
MADVFSKKKRSEIMSRISSKETKPEILVRKHLFAKGFRFIKNDKRLPGKPDIVLPKYKTAVFVHGCFWHHHKNCKFATLPQTNQVFWKNKIDRNVKRDRTVQRELKKSGWQVIIVWQCRLKNKAVFEYTLNRVIYQITCNSHRLIWGTQ